jgi:ParB family chromosome partitioning protein
MTSKAAQLGQSTAFAAAAVTAGTRRSLIEDLTSGDGAHPRTATVKELASNPFNPRHTLTELQEMADSLLEHGQLLTLVVVTREAFLAAHLPKHPDCEEDLGDARFVVIDGNRRLGGAKLAGLEEMRIEVNDDLASSAADVLEIALVIGIQHQSLSPLDEAEALAELVKVHGSQRAVGRRLSKTHVWVGQRLALLNLIPELRAALDAGTLLVEDARKIGQLPQAEQAAAVSTTATARRDRNEQRRTRDDGRPDGDQRGADRGNAVTTPPPAGSGLAADAGGPDGDQRGADRGNAVTTPPPASLDLPALCEDLPALAALLREHLSAADRQALAGLLTAAG